ncbi:MAG: hypothetical protein HJJLKODD_01943 [Phycisphaerae bacterium]|nr:hypothetical protein [Phycisphaerae bacterium]
MIATLILGFGLLMIGAVLPIAWQGSVRTTALSQAEGAVDLARTLIQEKCQVDSTRDLYTAVSFHDPLQLGGDGPDYSPAGPGFYGISYCLQADWNTGLDSFVRPLHLENWALDNATGFQPTSSQSFDLRVPEASILIAPPAAGLIGTPANIALTDAAITGVGAPLIALRERVFPPLPANLLPTDNTTDVTQWEQMLDSRLFAWSVLYKFARQPVSPNDPRHLLMYYFTLRRGSPTNRYVRQDHANMNFAPPGTGETPLALGSAQDVAFPIAWRVPLLMVESQSPGIPAIAFAGADPDDPVLTALFPVVLPTLTPPVLPIDLTTLPDLDNTKLRTADLFPPGTYFVDQRTGHLYRVMEREFLDVDNHLARLTLDIPIRGSDWNSANPGPDGDPETLDDTGEATLRNRIVWVYPPAASNPNRLDGDEVRFVGPSPVVDVKVEPLTLLPQ